MPITQQLLPSFRQDTDGSGLSIQVYLHETQVLFPDLSDHHTSWNDRM
jgi:hypothetical protein